MIYFSKNKNQVIVRIYKAIYANSFGLFINIISQLAVIPIFISHWGTSLYGEWILLSAIPAYLTSGDLGFCAAAANQISIYGSRGDNKNSIKVFHSGLMLVSILAVIMMVIVILTLNILDIKKVLNINSISGTEAEIIISLLSLQIISTLPGELINGGYRSVGRYSEYLLINNIFKILEILLIFLSLIYGAGPIIIALIYLLIRVILMIFTGCRLKQYANWFSYSFKYANSKIIKSLLSPALAFSAFPIGNAIVSQGVILAIGAKFDSSSVVTFNTLRILARFITTASSMVSNSIVNEITFAYGAENYSLLRKICNNSTKIIFLIALLTASILFFFQTFIFKFWLGREFLYSRDLYFFILISCVLSSVWKNNIIIISSCNKHINISIIYILLSLILVISIYYLSLINSLTCVSVAIIIYDILMIILTFKMVFLLTGNKIINFFKYSV